MPEKSSLILYQLGGAAADVPKDATSVYHRDGKQSTRVDVRRVAVTPRLRQGSSTCRGDAAATTRIVDLSRRRRGYDRYWLVIAAGWSTTSWFSSAASNREKTLKWVKELKDALKPYLNGLLPARGRVDAAAPN